MQHKSRRTRSLQRSKRAGVTAVEFAFVAPIFFLLLGVSFEYGRLNIIRHTADNAAYEAARHVMVPGATAAEAVTKANSLLNVVGTRGATVTVNPAVLDAATEEVTVTIDIPMNQNGWFVPRFSNTKTLRSQSRLKTERTGQ
jgi:Flp pilus assembly protein TadG